MIIRNLCFAYDYYRPQRNCGQGYVFTRVCDSVQGGSPCKETPWEGGTPWQGDHPPKGGTPPEGGTPPARRPLGRRHPLTRRSPSKETPPHKVNERPVHILLECILVEINYPLMKSNLFKIPNKWYLKF